MLNLAKPQRKKKTQRKRKKGAGSCLDQDIWKTKIRLNLKQLWELHKMFLIRASQLWIFIFSHVLWTAPAQPPVQQDGTPVPWCSQHTHGGARLPTRHSTAQSRSHGHQPRRGGRGGLGTHAAATPAGIQSSQRSSCKDEESSYLEVCSFFQREKTPKPSHVLRIYFFLLTAKLGSFS